MRRNLIPIAVACLSALLAVPVTAQDGGDAAGCHSTRNLVQSQLAMPGDDALNIGQVGGLFVVAMDCPEPAYRLRFPVLLEQAETGDADAMDAVGFMYAEGAGTGQDWAEAVTWLTRAAQAGSARAHYRLGVIAQHGLAGQIDGESAVLHFGRASDGGIGWASTNLGVIFLNGIFGAKDVARAVALFELGRSQGDSTATQNLAALHATGAIDGAPDFTQARRYAREAALADNLGGIRMYAAMLANGQGGERDIRTAYQLATIASERGDSPATQLRERIAGAVAPRATAEADRALARCDAERPVQCVLGE